MRLPHVHKVRVAGATAVEFAFVFPILVALVYGVIVYSYVFVLYESMSYAVQEAAVAAVAVVPRDENPDYDAAVTLRVRETAQLVLNWLPKTQRDRVLGDNGDKVEVTFDTPASGGDAVTVKLTFNLRDPPLFPFVTLPFVGEVPRLPTTLVVEAVTRV